MSTGTDHGSDNFVERVLANEKSLPPIKLQNILNEIQWISFLVITIPPVLAVYALIYVPLQYNTFIWAVAYYFATGFGITAGYHRYWSHRSYSASLPLRIVLMCLGSGAVQGSARWWARGHRSHHRYTDTDLDPYGAHTGLLWAHVGWMVFKPRRRPGPVSITDLDNDPVIKFQHKHYVPLMFFFGFIFPAMVGYLWNDFRGAFFYAGICRLVFVHHSTFSINSLAHYLGDASYDRKHSPRDNWITALATVGEGYHNFHHEFPMDYRNAVVWYQYDPTKWFIWAMSQVGLASNLKQFPENEIKKGRLVMQLADAHEAAAKLNWPKTPNHLPVVSWNDFVAQSKTRPLIVVHGYVHDLSGFQHPGGNELLASRIGKDATTAFEGGVYEHSNAAHNMLSMRRVAILSGGYKLAKDERVPAEQSMVNKDAAEYVCPGEAYKIVKQAALSENVRVQGSRYGKLF